MWTFDMRYYLLLHYSLFLQNLEKGWRVGATPFVFVVIASQIGLKIHRIVQTSKDSDKIDPSTETNNTSYESPNTQLFGARSIRAWHYHGDATPTSRKTVCYFSF